MVVGFLALCCGVIGWMLCLSCGGTSNVTEWYVVGHLDGDTRCKCTDLFVDVHKEGVGFPSAHFANGDCVYSIEMHGHGSSCSEGVTADIIFGIA